MCQLKDAPSASRQHTPPPHLIQLYLSSPNPTPCHASPCRVPPDELQQVLDKVPVNLFVAARTEGCWEVRDARPNQDAQLQQQGHTQAGSTMHDVMRCMKAAAAVPRPCLHAD